MCNWESEWLLAVCCLLPFLTHRCHFSTGIIEAVAKDFFDTDVAMSILDMNEEVERTGKKEHVMFLVVQKARRQARTAKANRSQDGEDIDTEQEVPIHCVFREHSVPRMGYLSWNSPCKQHK